MTTISNLDLQGTLIYGRKALADNDNLRAAWTALLEAVAACPLPDRVAFTRYVRLIHGSEGSLTVPEALDDDAVDRIREGIAALRRPSILEDVDVEAAVDSLAHPDYDGAWARDLAGDRPDRG